MITKKIQKLNNFQNFISKSAPIKTKNEELKTYTNMNTGLVEKFTILDFDSKIFGFKVAKILVTQLTERELNSILAMLRTKQVKLVYWITDQNKLQSEEVVCKSKGFLADMKVTYVTALELKNMQLDRFSIPSEIIEYKSDRPCLSIQKIAMEAGNYSRFKVDPQFPEHLFIKLYKTWIRNSTNGKIARHVLIFKKRNRYAGLITLGEKNGRGDIGLLAVDPYFRGQKIGEKLVIAAQKYFLHDRYKFSQVVTQLGNRPACNLYEKCGYKLEKIENVYHFWL